MKDWWQLESKCMQIEEITILNYLKFYLCNSLRAERFYIDLIVKLLKTNWNIFVKDMCYYDFIYSLKNELSASRLREIYLWIIIKPFIIIRRIISY